MTAPETDRGRRLLWMYATSPVDPERPNGERWPERVDARLVERIAEEFVPDIETEAVASFLRSEYAESLVSDALRAYNDHDYAEGEHPIDVKAITAAVVAKLRWAAE